MYLTRHHTFDGPRWALDNQFLPRQFSLGLLLELPQSALNSFLEAALTQEPAVGSLLAPVDNDQEVWASGVTYLRSRDARQAESEVKDVYGKVYDAERPELFLKAVGWRVVGPQMPIRVRDDSHWNVPEPEVTLVINRHGEIVGFTAGNDVSSRDIEGENPLYLPQAKIYNRSCALGPGIRLADAASLTDVPIKVSIARDGKTVFEGDTSSAQMKRTFQELAKYLGMELDFPRGVLLMTGTGIVPGDDFNLQSGDLVTIKVDTLILENEVMA
jgi:2-dehydro-3-deoxy-D-arabinonate dehydratase